MKITFIIAMGIALASFPVNAQLFNFEQSNTQRENQTVQLPEQHTITQTGNGGYRIHTYNPNNGQVTDSTLTPSGNGYSATSNTYGGNSPYTGYHSYSIRKSGNSYTTQKLY